MGAILADALAALAVAILQWWASRQDLQNAARSQVALEAAALAQKALEWEVQTPIVPPPPTDPLAGLPISVRPDSQGSLRTTDTDTPKPHG